MWRTSVGNRVLRGGEARLFAMGVLELLPRLGTIEHDPDASAIAFYRLSQSQQLVILCQVVEALLRPSVAVPAHTAANEASIAAVFDGVRRLLSTEIDEDISDIGGPVRNLLRRLMWRHGDGEAIPYAASSEIEEWDGCIETLIDRILWDRDFEEIQPFGAATNPMPQFSLPDVRPEYFTHRPGEPPEPIARLFEERIRALCEAIA